MRTAYAWSARLLAVCVLVQAAAIALGVFLLVNEVDEGLVVDESYEGNWGLVLHGVMGTMVVPLLAIVFLLVSLFARVPGGVRWAGAAFGLVVLQITLAFVAFAAPVVGALHALNAFAILYVSIQAARRATASSPASPAPTAVAA
jgi:hypothetical protein